MENERCAGKLLSEELPPVDVEVLVQCEDGSCVVAHRPKRPRVTGGWPLSFLRGSGGTYEEYYCVTSPVIRWWNLPA